MAYVIPLEVQKDIEKEMESVIEDAIEFQEEYDEEDLKEILEDITRSLTLDYEYHAFLERTGLEHHEVIKRYPQYLVFSDIPQVLYEACCEEYKKTKNPKTAIAEVMLDRFVPKKKAIAKSPFHLHLEVEQIMHHVVQSALEDGDELTQKEEKEIRKDVEVSCLLNNEYFIFLDRFKIDHKEIVRAYNEGYDKSLEEITLQASYPIDIPLNIYFQIEREYKKTKNAKKAVSKVMLKICNPKKKRGAK